MKNPVVNPPPLWYTGKGLSLGGVKMAVLRIIVTIVFILICIALTVLVLMQEGKASGLGAISGMAETYWGKNKGRSMEGTLVKVTKYLAISFIVIAAILNISRF